MKSNKLYLTGFIVALMLHCSLQSQLAYFQSGIQTLIVQRTPNQEKEMLERGYPFTIHYRQSFSAPPLALVAPLTFTTNPSHQNSGDQTRWSWIRLRTSASLENEMNVFIESTQNVAMLKISYFFVKKQVAKLLGLQILHRENHEYKGYLNKQKGDIVKLKFIAVNYRSQTQYIQESFALLPFSYDQSRFFVIGNEMKIAESGENYQSFGLEKIASHIQIKFTSIFGQEQKSYLSAISYTILVHLIHPDPNHHFELFLSQTSVTIPYKPFSKRIALDPIIFVGLSGYFTEDSRDLMNIFFSSQQNVYIMSRNNDANSITTFNFTIIALADENQPTTENYTSRILLTCTSQTFATKNQNHWQTWTDPTRTSTQTCQPCPTGCFSCVYCQKCLRQVNCTFCRSGFNYVKLNYGMYPDKQMVCTCPSGTYPNATTITCQPCSSVIPNCASCKTYNSGHYSATCATCKSGYFAVENSGSWGGYTECAGCIPGCTSCKGTASNCSTCGTGFKKVSGVCVCSTAGTFVNPATGTCATCSVILPNCQTCVAGANTTCSACQTGFILSTTGTCITCQPNCNTCTATACTSCKATFVASGTSCVCSSSPQMLLNSATNTCALCASFVPSCAVCGISGTTVTCTTCSPGTFPSNSTTCSTCPTACLTCTSAAVCQSCVNNLEVIGTMCNCNISQGNYLNNLTNTCVSCSQVFPQCAYCTVDNVTSALSCASCEAGSFLTDGACDPCPSTCTSCSAINVCGGCVTGYQLHLNATDMCGCINCPTCSQANVTNCAICDLNDTANSFCTLCETTAFLSNGTCILCPPECATCTSSTVCQTCNLPFIASTPPSSCICNSLSLLYYNPVGPTCSNCASIPGISASCASCLSTGSSTSCTSCVSGNYFSSGTCIACSYPCTVCSTAVLCSACAASFLLGGTSCGCDTANQKFLDTSVHPNVCISCPAITSPQCLSCTPNALATLTSGIACTSCQEGSFLNPATYLCTFCPSTCTVCTSLLSCSQCQNTYILSGTGSCVCDTANGVFLYGQVCLSCRSIINYCQTCTNTSGVVVCAACGTGTYLSSDNSTCLLCPLNCDSCSLAGCTNCSAGYFKNANGVCDCLTTCAAYSSADPSCIDCSLSPIDPLTNISSLLCNACKMSTFVVSNENCNACPPTCATCTDYVNCLTCEPSFTLINNNCECNTEANDVAYGNICKNCEELVTGCISCTVSGLSATCTSCRDGWGIDSGVCYNCGLGCRECTVASGVVTSCTDCYSPTFTLINGSCSTNTTCYNTTGFYDDGTSSCIPCMDFCSTCNDGVSCVTCEPTFSFLKNRCMCNNGLNMFRDHNTNTCIACQSALDPFSTLYLSNCKVCHQSTTHYTNGIQCQQCQDRYYLFSGTCLPCMNGCQKCSTNTTCCSCNSPSWIMINSTCRCNNDLNYFFDGNSSCLTCSIANCSVCTNLTTCMVCNFGSFLNAAGNCMLSNCGNGVAEGIQQCDDGNSIANDGCSPTCQVQPYYFCINDPPPSVCLFDSRFNIKLTEIISACNKITFKFQIYPYYSYYDQGNFDNFLYSNSLSSFTRQTSISRSGDIVSYTFSINQTLQGLNISLVFDPSGLQITQTIGYPTNYLSFSIEPTNNLLALYYEQSVCESTSSLQTAAAVIEYGSYGIMGLSALPSKIIGLELIGVVQLAFFSLGSLDNVNIMMSPLMRMKGINGFSMEMGSDPQKSRLLQSQPLTPERIKSIGYNANFLRNCNIMLIMVIVVIAVSFCLYILAYLILKYADTLHKIAQRMIKEFLLTLILFNCLNFGYSAGIHFRYAVPEDSLYIMGTLAAVATLVVPVLMAIGLGMAAEEDFGQFKNKMKPGCIEKAYFVITIIYRMSLGLYMSTSNEDELSTLIVLALSILFLLYNLVNLPFTKAYHNYRANICHFCQFIILFIAMYYRSMKSSASNTATANTFSPVYLEYACIMVSLVVSLIVLVYETYLWAKDCCAVKEESNKVTPKKRSEESEANNRLNNSMNSMESEANEKVIHGDIYEESHFYKEH